MKRYINRNLIRIILIVLLILSLLVNFLFQTVIDHSSPLTFTKQPEENIIFRKLVYISGEVNHPGVYEVGQDTRIAEVIEMAGGLTDDADREVLASSINLAKILEDEEKVFIPNMSNNVTKNTVNLNTSSQKELEKLPGIGPVTAGYIINIRPINSLSDLLKVKNFSEKKILDIKDLVSL